MRFRREAMLKGAASEAVKDGYSALKRNVAAWVGADVEALEKTPGSAIRRALVAEAIDARSADEQIAALALAQELISALKEAASGPVGPDIGRLDTHAVDLGTVTMATGSGVRIGEGRVLGTFKTGDMWESCPEKIARPAGEHPAAGPTGVRSEKLLVGGDMTTIIHQHEPTLDDLVTVLRGQASRNNASRRRVRVPVTIQPLCKVQHLREHVLRHHLEEWPRPGNCLDPQKWGHLGDHQGRLDRGVMRKSALASMMRLALGDAEDESLESGSIPLADTSLVVRLRRPPASGQALYSD
jgi:hypothetical protein